MRCARCGYVNAEGNRFCGMCGGPLVADARVATGPGPAEVVARPAAAPRETLPSATVQKPAVRREEVSGPARASGSSSAFPASFSSSSSAGSPVEAPAGSRFAPLAPPAPTSRLAERASESPSTVITGPSFLGLNRPPDERSAGRSNDLDYLLEEEEEPRRGWGKMLAVVVALALLGGFGYLRWKQGGFDFVTKGMKPATSASPKVPDATASGAANGSSPGTTANSDPVIPTDGTSNGASSAPASGTSTTPTTPDATSSQSAPAPGAAGSSSDSVSTNSVSPTPGTDTAAAKPADAGNSGAEPKAADTDSARDSPAIASVPKRVAPAKKIREPKPSPALPVDNTVAAERYIYGRGVRQDCDEGLRLLKPAAQANPKAMITLGSLYSTGTCTPRDLPTAYRWFAMALHKQPDNVALQDDLKKLWGQMTPPERQLAIRLSQ